MPSELWRVATDAERVQNYRTRYWNDAYFNALASIEVVAQKHNLTLAEIALRWVSHHSLMKREHGDSIIIGASSLNHIEQVSVTNMSVRTTLTCG